MAQKLKLKLPTCRIETNSSEYFKGSTIVFPFQKLKLNLQKSSFKSF